MAEASEYPSPRGWILRPGCSHSLIPAKELVTQSCLTLYDNMDCRSPGQEYWHGLPFSSKGDLLDPGIKPGSPALQADSLPPGSPGKSKLIPAPQ